jgi:hypothetical protein
MSSYTQDSRTIALSLKRTMWTILDSLPRHTVEEVLINIAVTGDCPGARKAGLSSFDWLELTTRLRERFTSLSKIGVRLGDRHFMHPTDEFDDCVAVMRGAGLEGCVDVDMVPVSV